MVETYLIVDEQRRRFALAAVVRIKADRERPMQVRISKPTRNGDQNRHIHALLGDIADQIGWPKDTGELHDIEWWKRRTTLQWLLDRKERPEIITPLEDDGAENFAILLPHTSTFDIPQGAEYIEWLYAFGVKQGVVFKEPQQQPEPPPPEEAR